MALIERDIAEDPNRGIAGRDGTVLIFPFVLVILPLDMDTGTVGAF